MDIIKHLKIKDSFPYTIDFTKVKSVLDGRFVYKVIHDGNDGFGFCNAEMCVDENNDCLAKIKDIRNTKI